MVSKRLKSLLMGGLTAVIIALVASLVYARLAVPNATAELPTRSEELARPDSLERQRLSLNYLETDNPYGSYTTSFVLSGMRCDTDIYNFKGNAIQMMVLCYRSDTMSGNSEYFSVELHRMEAGFIDVLVETTTLKRAGGNFYTWENLVPGDYYLRFTKSDVTQTVYSDYVTLSGYMEFAPEGGK